MFIDTNKCSYRLQDLREELQPDSIRDMRFALSFAVGNAMDAMDAMDAARRSRPFGLNNGISARDFKVFGLEDVPPYPEIFGSALQEKIELGDLGVGELKTLAAKMLEHPAFRHYIPPCFGYKEFVYLERPFWFVHFTTSREAKIIELEGFVGREDTDALFSTKKGMQSELSREGFVFAYLLDAKDEDEAVSEVYQRFEDHTEGSLDDSWDDSNDDYNPFPYKCVVGSSFVVGQAVLGVEAFHLMDKERQLIVPVSCIEADTIQVEYEGLDDYVDY